MGVPRSIRIGRIAHYGQVKAQWFTWKPSVQWSRQGASWCLDLRWLCFFTSTYWNDRHE